VCSSNMCRAFMVCVGTCVTAYVAFKDVLCFSVFDHITPSFLKIFDQLKHPFSSAKKTVPVTTDDQFFQDIFGEEVECSLSADFSVVNGQFESECESHTQDKHRNSDKKIDSPNFSVSTSNTATNRTSDHEDHAEELENNSKSSDDMMECSWNIPKFEEHLKLTSGTVKLEELSGTEHECSLELCLSEEYFHSSDSGHGSL
ncbi:hypothetical protein THOM_1318, partial [Trachipleistophora hominis]